MQHLDGSTFIFVAFVLLGIAALLGLCVLAYGLLAPLLERASGGVPVRERVGDWWRTFRHDDSRDSDDDDDDIDAALASLLTLLPAAAIVVDEDGEVIRSNPEAYRLGIVANDAVVEPHIAQAVKQVRETGGRMLLDVTTQTASLFEQTFAHQQALDAAGGTVTADPSDSEDAVGSEVSRPNWLKVRIGRIDAQFVVILIEDVSEQIRFNQVRDDFIVNVSEQLLKPGQELRALADSLERGETSRDQLAQDARRVRISSNHVDHMVSDLLLLIKAQEPVKPSSANLIDLGAEVQQTVATLQPMAQELEVDVQVSVRDAVQVHGESGQLRSAITKLVENAMEYSPQGGVVNVIVSRTRDGREASVRVVDRGSGIPLKDQSRIFERFYRGAEHNGRNDDGVGLGLAIVKHVALTHHGSVGVWSRPGQGSTFTLLLPLA
ncbi:sensor histidine kinase [Bifidobacterium gallicum]|uniref:Sensor-like histidine kinase SenX3 n=1 Tax=Bifidobacterium gallicum DSM 20093 = LMG 11596 TaxID=561180 RepID=D1NV51_9BIFI|nr:ATP-binding protein [Bifidobacterium gallicum]EFA22702.1 ATPase/histidine kinase/DNA gyrase B/HSP90 domain protein [Bifidobacterium gallicum DSM 20093 = LMG 11596]KFI59653.1 signal transduction histidine kinase [Bifidobacterium gallicum DSM 20093 = LMG 11596]